jgi:hypothetical protein
MLRTPVVHRVGISYVMLLQFSGRKNGRVYTIPVGYHVTMTRSGPRRMTVGATWSRRCRLVSCSRPWCAATGEAICGEQEAIAGMATLVRVPPSPAGIEIGQGPPRSYEEVSTTRSGRLRMSQLCPRSH